MRLGGLLRQVRTPDPESWVRALREHGFGAAFRPPIRTNADESEIRVWGEAAKAADIVIAEWICWKNPLDPDPATRKRNREELKSALHRADVLGANCVLAPAGYPSADWDAPHASALTKETFDAVVETARAIIDEVQPARTFYTVEPMPWGLPDSADNYVRLLKAVDRDRFAAHIDIVNWLTSPQAYFNHTAVIEEAFAKLGPYIKSCHVKDTLIQNSLTMRIDEVRPGLGTLEHGAYLRAIEALGPDTPAMIEHLQTRDEVEQAAKHLRAVAQREGIALRGPITCTAPIA
ncbi:MAG: sugar phosphate isomerase/epimerase [Kiritimatiellae bacterium]|nr:sugar phosphate isomerase/epimerase [Kiritimatiellia bacterium]